MYSQAQANAIMERILGATTRRAEYLEVDAILGRMMLDCNREPGKGIKGANRRSFPHTVRQYRDAMLTGEWIPTDQGIGFDTNKMLTNGAHRLKGLLQAAAIDPHITVEFLVCSGLAPGAKLKTDTGRTRTGKQALGMEGYVNTSHLASALRMVWCYDEVPYEFGEWELRRQFSSAQLLDAAEKYHELADCVVSAYQLRSLMSVPAAAVATYLAERDGPQGAGRWFNARLRDGLNLTETDPVWRLRRSLERNKDRAAGARMHRLEQLALWIKMFNAQLAGRTDVITPAWKKSIEPFPRIETPANYGKDDEASQEDVDLLTAALQNDSGDTQE